MFLWFPLPTKASWHSARESAESGGTIHLEINFSSEVYTKSWVIIRIGSILLDIGLPVLHMRNAD